MTRQQWLATLEWHEGAPSVPRLLHPIWGTVLDRPQRLRVGPGMALRLRDGRTLLVGDINEMGGTCDCCSFDEPTFEDVVAWAELFVAES